MPGKKITVVISQAPGRNPVKRNLEEEIAAQLILDSDVDVSIVPHLYDLSNDHTGTLFLRGVAGDVVVLSWLYPRAARWVLDRLGVKGEEGQSLLKGSDEDEEEDESVDEAVAEAEPRKDALGAINVPKRKVYCLDLRTHSAAATYLTEIRRIARDCTVQTFDLMSWVQGQPKAEQLQRYLNPVVRSPGSAEATPGTASHHPLPAEEATRRRWYPVIDYSRCTNCMECIDFCLFGVYGVDTYDRILVEQQDNCKKGCPACSRVCPENAIIFPDHKTPGIAGADTGNVTGLKIDLSKLFGGLNSLDVAVEERDRELVADGREAVGMTVGVPKRQAGKAGAPRDALDDLMDDLDKMV